MNSRFLACITGSLALVVLAMPASWASLPPTASALTQPSAVSVPAVTTVVSSKQKPAGPALVLKLESAQVKPIPQRSSRMAYQTRLQNPNNPYGRSTFPIEPDEEATPAPAARPEPIEPPPAQPAVVTPPAQPVQQLQPVAQPLVQQRPQPALPSLPLQVNTPVAKAPVIDPWRQAQPVPEGTTSVITPSKEGQPFNLQTQKGALARTYMFRQLTPKPYKSYRVSVKALMASLHDTFVYLRDLNGELPNLQRLSAFQARVRVEWLAFQKRLPPDAEKFSSYKSIEVSVAELDAMSSYWINRNRVKRVYQGTLDQEYTDDTLFQTRIGNLKDSLANLEALAQTEREVVREVPYAY